MKRLFCCILSVVIAISVAACSKDEPQNQTVEEQQETKTEVSQPEFFPEEQSDLLTVIDIDASWTGYGGLPFDEFLKKTVPMAYSQAYEVKKCAVISHEKWNCEGFLDESVISEGGKAVTYVADLLLYADGEEKTAGLKFYMELTTENNLKAVGCESFLEDAGYGDVFEAEETELLLEDLIRYM